VLHWLTETSATRASRNDRGDRRIAIQPDRCADKQRSCLYSKPFTEYTTEDFNTLVSTTLGGFLYVSQLAVKQMLRQKSGGIVNDVHYHGWTSRSQCRGIVQIMMKGALNAVTRALDHDLRRKHSRKHDSAGSDRCSHAQTGDS
jgi:NAD(P)-dependent dehydrogenase (short-subunit alcohol dehydrogenase family)